MISRILIGACAAITLFFGSVHLAYTFFTDTFPGQQREVAAGAAEW
jgi:hypothetical protein